MRFVVAVVLCAGCSPALADEQVQRALIQRDQQSAEFAAGLRSSQERAALQSLHARQLREHMPNRSRMARERDLVFSPPLVRARPPEGPLPLPGGPRHGVDPIPAQGTPH